MHSAGVRKPNNKCMLDKYKKLYLGNLDPVLFLSRKFWQEPLWSEHPVRLWVQLSLRKRVGVNRIALL